jgi:hypothetical protein
MIEKVTPRKYVLYLLVQGNIVIGVFKKIDSTDEKLTEKIKPRWKTD